MEIFEFASRNKLRFTYRGQLTTEDLWDLTVQDLDAIYKQLMAQLRQNNEESLLNKNKPDEVVTAKLEIVKYIVAVKLMESERRQHEAEVRARKRRIMEVLAGKEDEALRDKSPDELYKMLEELE